MLSPEYYCTQNSDKDSGRQNLTLLTFYVKTHRNHLTLTDTLAAELFQPVFPHHKCLYQILKDTSIEDV